MNKIIIILIGALWPEEVPDMFCLNSDSSCKADTLFACQALCATDSNCVGIAWSTTSSGCYLCNDDTLDSNEWNYGFYRKPGNNKMHNP